MAMFGGPGRSQFIRPAAPKLPVELMRLDARCEEHRPEGHCCYFAVLTEGGYGAETIERELVDFVALKGKLAPPPAAKPAPDLSRDAGDGFVRALLKRKGRSELDRERLVDRDHTDDGPPEYGDYIVVNGQRISLGPRKP